MVLIGAGNVGYHLGHQLHQERLKVVQVFSRKITKARRLAKNLQAAAINNLSKVSSEADLYILAVHDQAIVEVAQSLPPAIRSSKLVVHTSGVSSSKILRSICKRYGILYPLQTFSLDRKINFSVIPICTNANRKKDREALKGLGNKLSNTCFEIEDEQRKILHVAAVFVNNFANHLFSIGAAITEREAIPFQLLLPLILETAKKVQDHPPKDMQTGPALRGDMATLKMHLAYLENYPELATIYRQLSKSINPKINF